jgi:hypothetical protein
VLGYRGYLSSLISCVKQTYRESKAYRFTFGMPGMAHTRIYFEAQHQIRLATTRKLCTLPSRASLFPVLARRAKRKQPRRRDLAHHNLIANFVQPGTRAPVASLVRRQNPHSQKSSDQVMLLSQSLVGDTRVRGGLETARQTKGLPPLRQTRPPPSLMMAPSRVQPHH